MLGGGKNPVNTETPKYLTLSVLYFILTDSVIVVVKPVFLSLKIWNSCKPNVFGF